MVITGTQGTVFCPDFGDILLSEVTQTAVDVEMTILYGDTVVDTLTEHYAPDADKQIIISGIGSLAKCYFRELPISGTERLRKVNATVTVGFVVKDTAGTLLESTSQKFLYADCRTAVGEAYKYRGFLTRHRRYKVRTDQAVTLSYINRGQDFGLGISYGTDGWLEFTESPEAADEWLYTRNLSPDTVLQMLRERLPDVELDADSINYYIAYTKLGKAVIDAVQYDVDRRHFPTVTQFLYYNCFGVPESLCCTGADTRNAEIDPTLVKMRRMTRKISTAYNIYHEVNTGFVSRTVRECFEDLVNSSSVYLGTADKVGDLVTITEINFEEQRPLREPINITITYRIANDVQRVCERDQSVDYRIFDHTFGEEFE